MNLRYDTDMAIDLKDESDYKENIELYEESDENYHLELIRLLNDNAVYHQKKGLYASLSFKDTNHLDTLQDKLSKLIASFYPFKKNTKVLICGLGNRDLACDRLGPLLMNQIELDDLSRISLLVPGVKGQTGIETYDLIEAYIQSHPVDVVIVVDALATSSIARLNRVIQLTDTGLKPGSGIGNNCKAICKEDLKVPVICIGVPTVVRLVNIAIDLFKQFGLDASCLDQSSYLNQVVMDKGCDLQVESLAKLIASSINQAIYENV
jgi:spore protease